MDNKKAKEIAPGWPQRRHPLRDLVNRNDLGKRNAEPEKKHINSGKNEVTSAVAPPDCKLREWLPPQSRKQQPIFDPDEDSKGDIRAVSEYAVDIFKYLKERERNYSLNVNFLQNHEITPSMRQLLFNWLVDVQIYFKFTPDTLHLTILIIDRVLEKKKDVTKYNFQLVGITAMLIAAKCEEVVVPTITEFVSTTDNSCSKEEILGMERTILVTLNFEVSLPTSIQFLRRYSKIAKATKEQYVFSKYLIELALLEYQLAWVLPSSIAAAACCLAIAVQNNEMDLSKGWSPTLVLHSGYETCDVRPVMARLAHLLINFDHKKFDSVYKKYTSTTVSKMDILEKMKALIVNKLAGELKG